MISPSPAVACGFDSLTESKNSTQGDGNFSTKKQKMTLEFKASDKRLGAKQQSLSPATPSSNAEAVLHGVVKDVAVNSSVLQAAVDMKESPEKWQAGRTEEKGAKEYTEEMDWVDGRQTKRNSDVQKQEADIATMPPPSQGREISFPVIYSVDFECFEKVVAYVLRVSPTEECRSEVRRRFNDYVKSGKLSAVGIIRSSDGGLESIVVKDKKKSPPPRDDEEIKVSIPFRRSGRFQRRQHEAQQAFSLGIEGSPADILGATTTLTTSDV